MRRRIGIGTRAAIIGGIGFGLATGAQAQESLTVALYGGEWGDAIQACIIDRFVEETGVRVTPEPGVSTVTLAKLQQQRGSPVIDVAWIDGGISELAEQEGLVAPIDPGRVPNANEMIPEGAYRTADGEIYALSTGFYSLGLVYNTSEVEEAPDSWWDLWDDTYADLVTVPSPANAMGVPFFVHVNRLLGGDFENLQPGIERLRELPVAMYFDASGQATNSFQTGEVILGAHYASAAWAMADGGLPIAYAVPAEGAPSGDIRVHLVEGTANQELAERFIDFAVSVESASCLTEQLYVGPATSGVEPSEQAAERLPWGKGGSVDDLALFDWYEVNARRDELTEVWNREIVRR